MGSFAPVKGKCTYWRESVDESDEHDIMVKPKDYRVHCTCFVEGKVWERTLGDLPKECPDALACRYYIKT